MPPKRTPEPERVRSLKRKARVVLAFGHFVIALAFVGALRDPVRNLWIIEFGMIACLLVIPWALVLGPIRGIPFFWRLIWLRIGRVSRLRQGSGRRCPSGEVERLAGAE